MAYYGEEFHGFTYDVFLSFHGKDTRHNFTAHFLQKLQEKGINTFFDEEELDIGKGISPTLLRSIEDSKISIIVFSENYASSKWCLIELAKIMECTEKNNKQLAFPIFYHVDPSDIRNQRNSYGEAMIGHEKLFGKDSEKIQAWRSALSKAGQLKGYHIDTGSEPKHLEKIIEKVCAKIAPKPLYVDEDLVGLKHRIEEVKSLLDPKDDCRCMVGIYGLGGVGKTELAKVLYNEIAHQFEAASFLANVRENSKKKGLEHLQMTLLSEMFEPLKINLGSAYKGVYEIKRKLQKKKVLLDLDDVDHIEQLDELAAKPDWFGFGSRIIITTRDKALLDRHQFEKMNYYEMTELNDQHSLELFSQKAFKTSYPKRGYEDMSALVVGYAKGLPLALKVIGSHLSTKKSFKAWQDALDDYERIPRKEIQDVLRVSYDALDRRAKTVFLDIACIFKLERKEYVEKILKEFGATMIEELVDKSLLTIEHGCVNMHDLLQDMGMEVVRETANNLGEYSRLWSFEDILEVLRDDLGSNAIEAILLDPPQQEKVDWSGTAFKKMTSLRILIVRNTSFTVDPAHLPNSLRMLHWDGYPSKSFPPNFYPRKIVGINLTGSQITLEESFKKFSHLTFMNFSKSQSITTMPDVSGVENLRELTLDHCKNLITVHESVGTRKDLVHVSVVGCTRLANFLQRMSLPSLEVLDLNFCQQLEQFPDISCQNDKPLKISTRDTSIERLPDSIANLTGLVSLEMSYCQNLKCVPSSLLKLRNIIGLEIEGCSKLGESFIRLLHYLPSEANDHSTLRTMNCGNCGLSDEHLHAILTCFPKLEELIAAKNNFVSLPTCIKELSNLTRLDVSHCEKLQKVPECAKLSVLKLHGCVALEHITELPNTIQNVDARHCYSLSTETSDMLWEQVKKERCKLEIAMPQKEFPEWFDYSCNLGFLQFWTRGKFPNVALALVFKALKNFQPTAIGLHLFINRVHCKNYYRSIIEPNHVLVCDLQVMFSKEEWLGLDAFLKHNDEWNQVQIIFNDARSIIKLSSWEVFVYKKEGTKMEDIQFISPSPEYLYVPATKLNMSDSDGKKMMLAMLEDEAHNVVLEVDLNLKLINQHKVNFRNAVTKGRKLDVTYPLIGLFSNKGILPMDVGEASTFSNQESSDVEDFPNNLLEQMMIFFKKGMVDGLCEARTNLPSLDIDTIMVNVLEKGKRVSLPNFEEEEEKIFMEGVINVLLEARDNFPSLNIDAFLDFVIRGIEITKKFPSLYQRNDKGSSVVEGSHDPQQKAKKLMESFLNGMGVGLREVQRSFPSLDIDATMISCLNRGENLTIIQNKAEEEGMEAKMEMYREGIFVGVKEATNNFPTLDLMQTVNTLLSKGTHMDEMSLAMDLREGSVSTSSHESSSEVQGRDGAQEKIMMEIFLNGIGDGLREVQRFFPSLDIDATMISTINRAEKIPCLALKAGEEGKEGEIKMYIKGIVIGLMEATESFPTLDIMETMKSLSSRRIYTDGISPAMNLIECFNSTCGSGSSEVEGSNPRHVDIKISTFLLGMKVGIGEAHKIFPSIDIETTVDSALRNTNIKMYLHGILTGLAEAQLSFPNLDMKETLATVLSKRIQLNQAPLNAQTLLSSTIARHDCDSCLVYFTALLKNHKYSFGWKINKGKGKCV